MDRFQGDPKLMLTADGAEMQIMGGQPVMDQGLSNFVNISLFTKKGWFGNAFISDQDKKYGSDFLKESEKVITIQQLNNIRLAVEKGLQNPVVGNVEAQVINVEKNNLRIDIKISPPGQDVETLRATRNGVNWIMQAVQGE